MTKFCVYDADGDFFPPIDADEATVTDTGVEFYERGMLVARFERSAILGFQPEVVDYKAVREAVERQAAQTPRCPECGASQTYEHDGKQHCRVCGREIGDE